MSALSKSSRLSSSLKEEVMVSQKQGIVSILGSDCEKPKAASLRRTLSADMSSKKWLSQHGFSPLKKIASSEELLPASIAEYPLCSSSSSEGEEEDEENRGKGQFDIWKSIQEEKEKMKMNEAEKPGKFDIWSSILSQKKEDPKNLPPPYIHPLVKRSASSLSEKSLEICTESLGSETGSDVFSSYPPSETGDSEEEKEEEQLQQNRVAQKDDMEDLQVAKYNLAAATIRSQPRSFPPPISSLSSRRDGEMMWMRSHRDNGRLVVEAVSVHTENNFRAQRQDGRLVLTFINNPSEEEKEAKREEEKDDVEQFEVELENSDDENEETEEEEEEEEEEETEETEGGGDLEEMFLMEEAPKLTSGAIYVHRLAQMMNKPIALPNSNPTWPTKVKFQEEDVEAEEEEEEEVVKSIGPLTQSLPPRPRSLARIIHSATVGTAAAVGTTTKTSFNAYEYYWKPKPIAAQVLNPLGQKPPPTRNNDSYNNKNHQVIVSKDLGNEQQEMLVLRGNKGDYLVPLVKSCKETRRSLLFWEPYCIATS